MKKQMIVIASLIAASTALSAGAASVKEEKISISDILECVVDGKCRNEVHIADKDCPIFDVLDVILGEKRLTLSDLLTDLFDGFPELGKPETPDRTPDTEEIPDTPDIPVLTPDQTPDVPTWKPEETPEAPEDKPQEPTETPDEPNDIEQTDPSYESTDAYVNEVLALVNKYRKENGLSAVTLDRSLCRAADVRAKEIVSAFSHTRPNGQSCFTVLGELGISYMGAGENIAYGQSSPSEVMNAWMNSSGHRANILNGSFNTLGVGVYTTGGTTYWAQMFTNAN